MNKHIIQGGTSLNRDVVILLAEDDEGHAKLIRKHLSRAGIGNEIRCFKDGQEIIDFLFCQGNGPHRESDGTYILLLDIRMPKRDGLEVLKLVKSDWDLRKMPVVMITTSDDPHEIERCRALGCKNYMVKPVDYVAFAEAIQQLALFLAVIQVPQIQS